LEKDCGYTGINAAYVLDLLAKLETAEARAAAVDSISADAKTAEAKSIRTDLAQNLPLLEKDPKKSDLGTQYWFVVTVAEAFFGLELYPEAEHWLRRAAALPKVAPWEFETTARQLASLARQNAERKGQEDKFEDTEGWKALGHFLKGNEAALRTAFAGKVGLALSGGGFRASLFHIGVLARLAELDMLRHVEVLSCVSGGSVIGAHYYLEVRRLLEKTADNYIRRDDYIEIVELLQKNFLAGVQSNIRTRVVGSVVENIKMIFLSNYSRTERLGELFEQKIFASVEDDKIRCLNQLRIKPAGTIDFEPKYDNYTRKNKVPILVLNATSLNTGHVWQFTASWMGEPPGDIDAAIDGNERLRRMYYYDAPKGHRGISLGHAVAASTCVPGLFEPLALANLYPSDEQMHEPQKKNKRIVRLVDGGVHDNQGTASLLEANCTVQLVSDATGQMMTEYDPSRGVIGVPLRSNSILMSRVRGAQYAELEALKNASLLRGLMFIHLKKDLDVLPVNWIDCEDPEDPTVKKNGYALTSYGILKTVQAKLAAIRTDLDSFSEVEAFALMTSGYRMTEAEFAVSIRGFPPGGAPHRWSFLQVEPPMKGRNGCEAQHDELQRLLKVGANCAFKIWRLCPVLQVVALVAGVSALAGLVWWTIANWTKDIVRVGAIAMPIFTALAGLILGKTLIRIVRYRETIERVVIGLGLAICGWFIAFVHLRLFDCCFLRLGRVCRLLNLKSK
jgi:predicted acylesterase/phospholipase RssA